MPSSHTTDDNDNNDPIVWIVSLQNWGGHLPFAGLKPPPIIRQHFTERAAADAYKVELRQKYPDPATARDLRNASRIHEAVRAPAEIMTTPLPGG